MSTYPIELSVDALRGLVDISSPSGDVPGAEEALALCASLVPRSAVIERPDEAMAGKQVERIVQDAIQKIDPTFRD